jgi:thiamine biosynthesis lipoprotein
MHALASVSVLHPQCMQADGLATVLAVLGPQAGMAYANRRQLAAMFVLHDGDGFVTRMTPAFIARQRAA